jgi:AraC family ethanolamine operon transcriptional activator
VVAARDFDAYRALFGHVTTLGRRAAMVPDPVVAGAIRAELVELLACSLSGEGRQARARPGHRPDYTRIVRECAHYAEQRNYQGLTLADLSEVAGVSERQVRAAFSSVFGISPRGYLRVAALYEVRRRLVTGPPAPDPVSRAATDFGFWHLGRFAGQYRSLFGELPNETLEHRRDGWRAADHAVGRGVGA